MNDDFEPFDALTSTACKAGPVRVAVADAAQKVVLETLRDAERVGLATPVLVGDPNAIRTIAADLVWVGRLRRTQSSPRPTMPRRRPVWSHWYARAKRMW